MALPLEFFSAVGNQTLSLSHPAIERRRKAATLFVGVAGDDYSLLFVFDKSGVLHHARLSGIRTADCPCACRSRTPVAVEKLASQRFANRAYGSWHPCF